MRHAGQRRGTVFQPGSLRRDLSFFAATGPSSTLGSSSLRAPLASRNSQAVPTGVMATIQNFLAYHGRKQAPSTIVRLKALRTPVYRVPTERRTKRSKRGPSRKSLVLGLSEAGLCALFDTLARTHIRTKSEATTRSHTCSTLQGSLQTHSPHGPNPADKSMSEISTKDAQGACVYVLNVRIRQLLSITYRNTARPARPVNNSPHPQRQSFSPFGQRATA